MEKLNLFIYTETSLHAGTGSSVSVVDLPIQRERSTHYPLVQGSGVKGALRQQIDLSDDEKIEVFGPETANASDHAGALAAGDAQIVLFPVRSLVGVFAYVTSAHVLARIRRDVTGLPELKAVTLERGKAFVTKNSTVAIGSQAVLEEFTFDVAENANVTEIALWLAANALPTDVEYTYWREKLKTSLVVLSDDDFRDFVVNSTEITTRIKLKPGTKTVDKDIGALWTEEALPSDTLLLSAMTVRKSRKKDSQADAATIRKMVVDAVTTSRNIQIGGDETTGSGFVALRAV